MKDSEVLGDAAQYLREHGWHQGPADYIEPTGTACAVGAIKAVTDWPTAEELKRRVLRHLLPEGYENYMGQVEAWNDAEGRTEFEVINLLEKAAEQARSEGR